MNINISLPTAVSKVLASNWTKINDFNVYFVFPPGTLAKKLNDEMLNLSIKSLTLPAYTQQSIEVYTGGEWLVANGRPDLARVEMTFRDYDSFKTYRAMVDLYERTLGKFKDEAYVYLRVSIGDVNNESTVAIFKDLLIENVSQLNFDNSTEDQIAEFSVTMRGKRAVIPNTSYYGSIGSTLQSIQSNGSTK